MPHQATGRAPSTSSRVRSRRLPRGVRSAPTIIGSPTTIVALPAKPPRSCGSTSATRAGRHPFEEEGAVARPEKLTAGKAGSGRRVPESYVEGLTAIMEDRWQHTAADEL